MPLLIVLSLLRPQMVEHWVVRFARSLGLIEEGMPEERLILCSQRSGPGGKGLVAEHLHSIHHIDNSMECFWDVSHHIHRDGFVVYYDNERDPKHEVSAAWYEDNCATDLHLCSDWFQIAQTFGLDVRREVWDFVAASGPPHHAHSHDTISQLSQFALLASVFEPETILVPDEEVLVPDEEVLTATTVTRHAEPNQRPRHHFARLLLLI